MKKLNKYNNKLNLENESSTKKVKGLVSENLKIKE